MSTMITKVKTFFEIVNFAKTLAKQKSIYAPISRADTCFQISTFKQVINIG
jgi:hypothetical protein